MTKALLLDMDGVLIDSERQWKIVEYPFFTRLLGRWSDDDHRHVVGLGVKDLYHWLVKNHGLKRTQAEFLGECEGLAREIYGERVELTEGVPELLARAATRGLPTGLASSSPRAWIDLVMGRFGLAPHFPVIVSGDDAPGRTKPAPDIYLEAARRLGVAPEDCLAVEDSLLGVTAAKAAGMRCAAFRNGHNAEQDLSKADFEISAFSEIPFP